MERRNGTITIAPAGELDLSTAPVLERGMEEAAESGADRMVLDLTQLEFMDSAGVHALERLRARFDGERLVIRRPRGAAARVLEFTEAALPLGFTQQPR
jgi:anti-sigma B factor antagonist